MALSSRFIPDCTVEKDVMFVGGAYSTDAAACVAGCNWWRNEQLSTAEGCNVLDYQSASPQGMVTHDCPKEIADLICDAKGRRRDPASATQALFSTMLSVHRGPCCGFSAIGITTLM